ncbi:MAG: hypothetical protein H6713_02565 [Myxococcales bacterium]|nr:hypothetical protein [Myxococcales bacterium]
MSNSPVVSGSSDTAGARASPKSITRTRPSSPSITLSGLKSRCTSPAAWAAASPRAAARYLSTTSRHDRGCARSHARSVTPRMCSIATNTRPSCTPTSCTPTTLGWARRASAWASRSSRTRPSVRRSREPTSLGLCSTLIATVRSSSGSWAANTVPMPPAPSSSSTT